MKQIRYFSLIVLLFLFVTACTDRSYRVDGAGNTDANMGEYNTYAFASQVDNKLDPGFFFLNDLVLKSEIRDAVKHELDSRGYTHTSDSPDLVVNFRVYDQPTKIQSLQELGDNYWSSGEAGRFDMNETVNLEAGSIIVHLVDRQTGELVYQGYASGLMDGNVFNKDEDKIAEAVSMIFDQYGQRADNL